MLSLLRMRQGGTGARTPAHTGLHAGSPERRCVDQGGRHGLPWAFRVGRGEQAYGPSQTPAREARALVAQVVAVHARHHSGVAVSVVLLAAKLVLALEASDADERERALRIIRGAYPDPDAERLRKIRGKDAERKRNIHGIYAGTSAEIPDMGGKGGSLISDLGSGSAVSIPESFSTLSRSEGGPQTSENGLRPSQPDGGSEEPGTQSSPPGAMPQASAHRRAEGGTLTGVTAAGSQGAVVDPSDEAAGEAQGAVPVSHRCSCGGA